MFLRALMASQRNHRVFDADQIRRFAKNAIRSSWARLFRGAASRYFAGPLSGWDAGLGGASLKWAKAQRNAASHPNTGAGSLGLRSPASSQALSSKYAQIARRAEGSTEQRRCVACFWSMPSNSETKECQQRALECAQKALRPRGRHLWGTRQSRWPPPTALLFEQWSTLSQRDQSLCGSNACKAKPPAKPQWLKVQSSHSFSQAGRRYTGRQRQRLADGFRQQARK